MIKNHKNLAHFLILGPKVTGRVFIAALASLVDIIIVVKSSAIGLNIGAITAATKKI